MKRFLITSGLYLSALVVGLASLTPVALASGSRVFAETDKPTYNKDDTFAVRVYASSANRRGFRTRVDFTFPSNLVTAIKTETGGSAYGGHAFKNNNFGHNQGRITYIAFPIPAPTGDKLPMFTVIFKAKNTGEANFNFTGNTVVNDSATSASNHKVGIQVPSAPQPAQNQPQKPAENKPAQKPAANNRGATTTSRTPAQVYPGVGSITQTSPNGNNGANPQSTQHGNVQSQNLKNANPDDAKVNLQDFRTTTKFTTIDITWGTNHPADTTLVYGSNPNELQHTAKVEKSGDKQFKTTLKDLLPGEKYYYRIDGKRSGKDETFTQSGSLVTQGYPVEITLMRDGQPLTDATVTFKDTAGSFTSDTEGRLYFQVKDGTYPLTIEKDGYTSEKEITVKKAEISGDGKVATQKMTLELEPAPATNNTAAAAGRIIAIVGAAVLGLAALVGLFLFIRKKRNEKAAEMGNMVVIEDSWQTPPDEYAQYYGSDAAQADATGEDAANQYATQYDTQGTPEYDQTYAPQSYSANPELDQMYEQAYAQDNQQQPLYDYGYEYDQNYDPSQLPMPPEYSDYGAGQDTAYAAEPEPETAPPRYKPSTDATYQYPSL